MEVQLNSVGEMVLPQRATPALIRLYRDTPGHPALFDQAMARIQRFSYKYGGEPTGLAQELWNAFSQKDPRYGLWVSVLDGQVVGHLLASLQWKDGYPTGYVIQAESDVVLPKRFISDGIETLILWVHELNLLAEKATPPFKIQTLMMESHRMSEAWMRYAGFEPYRTIFRRLIHV